MRITYRTLAALIAKMNEDQLDYDLTVEDGSTDECYVAELRIVGENHSSLDQGHPIIYFDVEEDAPRRDDVDEIAKDIGL